MFGKYVTICGKMKTRITTRKSEIRNGYTPE